MTQTIETTKAFSFEKNLSEGKPFTEGQEQEIAAYEIKYLRAVAQMMVNCSDEELHDFLVQDKAGAWTFYRAVRREACIALDYFAKCGIEWSLTLDGGPEEYFKTAAGK